MEELRVEQGQSQEFTAEDIENNKVMALLAYIIFLVPLLAAKESKFAMFHTNQGLVLFLAAIAVNIVGGIVPIIGWFIPDFPLAVLVIYADKTGGPVAFAHSPANHARFRLGTDNRRRSLPGLPRHLPPIAKTNPCSVDSVC